MSVLTVRTLGNLRGKNAGVVAGEESGGVGLEGVSKSSLVVRLGEDGSGVTLLQAALLAGLLDLGRAAGDVAGSDATSLKLIGAVSQAGALDVAEESAALGDLFGEVVAGVGNGAGEEGQAGGDGGKAHVGCL